MKPENPVSTFFESIPEIPANMDIDDPYDEHYVISLATTAQMMAESVYVIDPYKCCFRHVSSGGIFLCGRSYKEVLQLGYNFYFEVVHPDDMPLVIKAHQEVLRYVYLPDTPLHDLDYMVFNFRIRNHQKDLMVCHKMSPMSIANRIRYIFCTVTDAVCKTPGNLLAYYKTGTECSRYSFESNRWNREPVIVLTQQEKNILMLSRQGKTVEEIAAILCLSKNTIRNHREDLFQKLGVKKIHQAIVFARNNKIGDE